LWEKGEFLDTRGYYRQALTLLEKTIQAARILADEATEAIHLKNMGRVQRNLGNLKEAENYYLLSLNYYRRSDNNKLQLCDLCYHLAFCYILQGRYQEASALIEQNLAIAVFIQDILVQKRIEAQSHYTLGNIAIGQNQWVEAQKYIEMSLQLYEDLSDATGRAESLYNLGVILTRQGNDLARASLCYQQSLEHWRTTGQFKSAAHTIFQIAILEQSQGNFTQAFIYLDQAEEVGRKIGDLLTQAMTKMHRGLTYLATQNKAAACQEWQVALELLGDKLPHWQERIMALVNMHCLDSNNVAV
jgi:tetratricopeptide (TPR) repeat protein